MHVVSSHLDRDGDGYISVGEVAILLEELGIDAGEQQAEAVGPGQGQGQGQGQLSSEGAGQGLLGALANKEPGRVTFEEFLQFNSQVLCCLLQEFVCIAQKMLISLAVKRACDSTMCPCMRAINFLHLCA